MPSTNPANIAATHQPRPLQIVLLTATLVSVCLAGFVILRYRGSNALPLQGGSLPLDPVLNPPALALLPSFVLTDQAGGTFDSSALRGKAWIADFIFTRCSGPCPAMTSRLATLQSQLAQHPRRQDIRLVTFTVDPEHDTPPVLAQYAQLAHADPAFWLFLTGPRTTVWSLVKNGFKLPVGDDPGNADMPIFHSQKLVLIDRAGRVRGFYDAVTNPDDNNRLRDDLDRVLQEPHTP